MLGAEMHGRIRMGTPNVPRKDWRRRDMTIAGPREYNLTKYLMQ